MRRVVHLFLALSMLTLSTNSHAQLTTVIRTDVRQIIRNLETDTDTFKRSLDHALDRSPLDGTRSEDEINDCVKQFEHATDKLKDRAEDNRYAPNLAREVLVRGRSINTFMRKTSAGRGRRQRLGESQRRPDPSGGRLQNQLALVSRRNRRIEGLTPKLRDGLSTIRVSEWDHGALLQQTSVNPPATAGGIDSHVVCGSAANGV